MIGEYKRYDVVLIDFGENTIGSEQGGIRPAIIIQNNKGNLFSNTTIVMPCTSNIKHLYQPTHALLKRIIKKMGTIENKKMRDKIKEIYLANFEG